jgi:maltooligosyltrehalose trehalohydrolase
LFYKEVMIDNEKLSEKIGGMTNIAQDGPGNAVGALRRGDGTWQFVVWAPKRESMRLHLLARPGRNPGDASTPERWVPMEKDACGYFRALVNNADDARYFYQLDGSVERPDPASRFQPEGVHGPSQTVDLNNFPWRDQNWKPPRLEDSVFYEVHIGTYTHSGIPSGTAPGTLSALAQHLDAIADAGVTTVELMPVAQFPGRRNWGYDGVFPYAVQNSYGGPRELQKFVDAAHARGLAVALDVVYNHLGPEGNYLGDYGPYFAGRYKTPWGDAINYDSAGSEGVREYFIGNALYWFENYHIDALRLDAIHGIFDFGAVHVLEEMQERVEALGKKLGRDLTLIAESDLNDARVLKARAQGGYALPSQWSDDFHHSVRALLTNEQQGYYADFGKAEDLAITLRDGWAYQWRFSEYRQRRHGNSPKGLAKSHFTVFVQNHDQVGNRAIGERLTRLTDFEGLKLAAGITLLSPFVPLLFMGEEYGEEAPFLYFTDHGDPELVKAVRKGRREEFTAFGWAEEQIPDPQEEATFRKSVLTLDWSEEPHRTLRSLCKELIAYRRQNRLGWTSDLQVDADEDTRSLRIIYPQEQKTIALFFNFGERPSTGRLPAPPPKWSIALDSADRRWRGPGETAARIDGESAAISPHSFLVLEAQREK